ncbi:MAG: secretin N-terminal domain-containing protein, partial [Verrucomicrobiota bacterium]
GPNTVKIVNTASKNPRSEGLPVYTNVEDLPPGEQVVSFFLPLQYLSAQQALPVLQGTIAQNPYASITPVENAQAIVITENTSVIRQAVKLKALIDVPPARLSREFVQLTRADAEDVAEAINEIINKRTQNNNRSGNRGNQQRNQGGGNNPSNAATNTGNSATEVSQLTDDVQLLPDPRTNRILVISPPNSFPFVRELILDFDSAVDFEKPVIRNLKYVKAGEILPVLGDMLAQGDEEAEVNEGNSRNTGNTGGGGGGGGGSIARNDQLSDAGLESSPQSLVVGKTRIVADRRNNSILILGPPESVNKAVAILGELDIPARQIFLSTVIGQLTLTDDTQFGVDILQKFERSGDFGVATQSTNTVANGGTLVDPTTLTTTAAFPAASAGLTLYGTFKDTLEGFVRALKTTGNFKILSRPTVFAANNKRAVILSGSRVPIPSDSLSTLDNTNNTNTSVTTTVTFEDVFLQLEVIPLINSDNEVTLTIAQTNDSISGTSNIGGNDIPIISTQQVQTDITVKNRSTIVLGGLVEDSAQDTISGIPILSDIPLLGNLFKTTNRSRPRTELVILVQPNIVNSLGELPSASQREIDRSFVGDDAQDYAEKEGISQTELESTYRLHRFKNPKKNSDKNETDRSSNSSGNPQLPPQVYNTNTQFEPRRATVVFPAEPIMDFDPAQIPLQTEENGSSTSENQP